MGMISGLPRPIRIIIFLLRISLGGLMLEAGLRKLLSGNFSAASYLGNAGGPLAGWFTGLANSDILSVLNGLVIWGEILIGIALILGLLVRFASFWGAVMMVLYYLAASHGSGWMSQHIIYLLVFISFMLNGTGYTLGLDILFANLEERRHPARLLFG